MNATVQSELTVSLPAPVLTKWEREYTAFQRLLPDLIQRHKGQYVAIHDGDVVGVGSSRVDVALEVIKKIGNVAIHVGLVDNVPQPVYRSGVVRMLRDAGA